jgi:hypothetical protein
MYGRMLVRLAVATSLQMYAAIDSLLLNRWCLRGARAVVALVSPEFRDLKECGAWWWDVGHTAMAEQQRNKGATCMATWTEWLSWWWMLQMPVSMVKPHSVLNADNAQSGGTVACAPM